VLDARSQTSASRLGLQNPQQALLMQHFIQVLASWYDFFDPQQHFALHVPYRAAQCPILKEAIFAVSARHLSKLSTLDPFLADRYYEQCIEKLIPMFDDLEILMDGDLLCATVILRQLEEFNGKPSPECETYSRSFLPRQVTACRLVKIQQAPYLLTWLAVSIVGHDHQRHLRGIQVLVRAQEHLVATSDGVHQAAYWAGFHQEVYMAFLTQRPVAPRLSSRCSLDRSLTTASDRTWALRLIVHCATILSFCHGQHGADDEISGSSTGVSDFPKRLGEWQSLLEYTLNWSTSCPLHFQPIFQSSPTDGSVFPIVYYHLPVHLCAAMYYYVCLILLALHDPFLEIDTSIGTNRIQAIRRSANALKELDAKIRFHVRTVCGIALCNSHLAPVMAMASAVITICGDYFENDTEEEEQEALLDVLVRNEVKHGWPTSATQQHLKKKWSLR